MLKGTKALSLLLIAFGTLLGYAAATGKVASPLRADDLKTAAQGDAQATSGAPGSPSATTTIDGKERRAWFR
jgi:hypothetical protein